MARRGEGHVEPNPMVGCVLVNAGQLVGEGWHQKFGGHHAEVNALLAAGDDATGSTAYVTLEPCSHHGKTPPCCDALIAAKVRRVVVACEDPNPNVSGQGIKQLRSAGIEVEVGLLDHQSHLILAPYLKRTRTGIPWIIAKWAMTLDGKIATSTGDSKWISNESSRAIVHQIRGRVDAILIGAGTANADNPLLTARPEGPRIATRIVMDSNLRIALDSQLCQTAEQFPTLIAVGPGCPKDRIKSLEATGCEVWQGMSPDAEQRLSRLLAELGKRGMTNVLVEGGSAILGALHDLNQIDEAHVFIGPKLIGGSSSLSPMAGNGKKLMFDATQFAVRAVDQLEDDVYIVATRVTDCTVPARRTIRSLKAIRFGTPQATPINPAAPNSPTPPEICPVQQWSFDNWHSAGGRN